MPHDPLFERLWNGTAPMEEWTQSVSHGAITKVGENVITVHTTYFCGSVTALRTEAGLVLIDTAKPPGRPDPGLIRTLVHRPCPHRHLHPRPYRPHGRHRVDRPRSRRQRPPPPPHHRPPRSRRRLARYEASHGFNSIVQGQQFNHPDYSTPSASVRPTRSTTTPSPYHRQRTTRLVPRPRRNRRRHLVFLPDRRVLASGDFVIWIFPNAGNPRKVQRYAPDWAATLRRMQALKPEILIPGHGPVIFGAARAAQILDDGAQLLEMPGGPDPCSHEQGPRWMKSSTASPRRPPAEKTRLPALRRSRVRRPRHLASLRGLVRRQPRPSQAGAGGGAGLGAGGLGGWGKAVGRAGGGAGRSGQTRLAAHLAEFAADAAPDDAAIQATRAHVLEQCMARETSLMGKAFLGVYQREAKARAGA